MGQAIRRPASAARKTGQDDHFRRNRPRKCAALSASPAPQSRAEAPHWAVEVRTDLSGAFTPERNPLSPVYAGQMFKPLGAELPRAPAVSDRNAGNAPEPPKWSDCLVGRAPPGTDRFSLPLRQSFRMSAKGNDLLFVVFSESAHGRADKVGTPGKDYLTPSQRFAKRNRHEIRENRPIAPFWPNRPDL